MSKLVGIWREFLGSRGELVNGFLVSTKRRVSIFHSQPFLIGFRDRFSMSRHAVAPSVAVDSSSASRDLTNA